MTRQEKEIGDGRAEMIAFMIKGRKRRVIMAVQMDAPVSDSMVSLLSARQDIPGRQR
jgi:hypothetical protein